MKAIEINNIRNISHLRFEIPNPGVHLLTGANGSGKTTLLTCLQRICDSYAFQKNFRTSEGNQFDNFNGTIKFLKEDKAVTYRYKNSKWAPTPKKESHLLSDFGFNDAHLISSTGKRFYIQEKELKTSRIQHVDDFIKKNLNKIFETQKFDNLGKIKLEGKGKADIRDNFGYVIPINPSDTNRKYYFTEKNFSLGEITVLNTLHQLLNVKANSLILVDEIELALHPKAQIKLYDILKEQADKKRLTVIISTHSSTLIKYAKNIINLRKNNNGSVEVISECYPALALREISVFDDIMPDYVIYTEDEVACYLAKYLVDRYMYEKQFSYSPLVKVLPVANWQDTLKLTIESSPYILPERTNVCCLLDLDAKKSLESISKDPNRSQSQEEFHRLSLKYKSKINFLPCTPEEGIMNDLLSNSERITLCSNLNNYFENDVDTNDIIEKEENRWLTYPDNNREKAKKKFNYCVDQISEYTNASKGEVKKTIFRFYVNEILISKQVRQTIGPILGS